MAEREPETHWVESLGFLKDGKGFLKKKNATVDGRNPRIFMVYGIFTNIWMIFMVNVGFPTVDGSEIGLITWDIKNS